MNFIVADHVRLKLQGLQTLGDEDITAAQSKYFHSITDVQIGAACDCNGHASLCDLEASQFVQCE